MKLRLRKPSTTERLKFHTANPYCPWPGCFRSIGTLKLSVGDMSNSLLIRIKEDIWNNVVITLQDECGQHVEMDGLMSHCG